MGGDSHRRVRAAWTMAALICLSHVTSQGTVSVTPAAKAAQASSISEELSPSFAGMGIEPSNLLSFTGGNTPNQLSINLLQNLAEYSGAPPHLRIGGNTGDYMVYNASYRGFDLGDNKFTRSSGGASPNKWIFGPDYLAALDRFPPGTPITYGLNLAYDGEDYGELICAEAEGVLDQLKNTKVVSFEIGNEPDLYLQGWNQLRTGTWEATAYTKQFLDRAGLINDRVLKPRGRPSTFFETASTAATMSNTFRIDDLANAGILAADSDGSKFVASWNQHDYYYFVGVTVGPLTVSELLNFDKTENQFTYWNTEVQAALRTGLPYNLREMQNVGPTGIPGISDTLGAALWTLNFFCYAATLGISSVQMHMTDNSFAAPWQPTDMNNVGPNIRPSYYAFAAVSQLIGSGNGTTRIASLKPDSATPNFRAYSAYTDDTLSSVVLINSNEANASNTAKQSLTCIISFPDHGGHTLYLSFLSAAGADSTSNATWNGISYEQDSVGTPTTVDSAKQSVIIASDGTAEFGVRDSQAVIARLDSLLGSESVSLAPSMSSAGSMSIMMSMSISPTSTTFGETSTATTTGSASATESAAGTPDSGASSMHNTFESQRASVTVRIIIFGFVWCYVVQWLIAV